MIRIERLHPAQWNLLGKIDDGYIPDASRSIAVVARAETGEAVGRCFLIAPAHVEGIFVRREYRDRHLMKRLVDEVELQAKKEGVKEVYAYAVDSEMAGYISRLKYVQRPWTIWSKELV